MGDLDEEFEYQMKKSGSAVARLDYVRNALAFSVMYLLKAKSTTPSSLNQLSMLKHYLAFVWRNSNRNKSISFIKLAGLSIGMLSFLVISLWVQRELSVDKFHDNGDQLYLVHRHVDHNGESSAGAFTPALLASELKRQFPEVQYASGFGSAFSQAETFRVGETIQKMKGFRAEADFFKMFTYPLVAGSVDNSFSNISSIAISRRMAEIFFGSVPKAIGSSIRYNNMKDFTVVAVFEDLPRKSTHDFDYIINWGAHLTEFEFLRTGWDNYFHYTYVKLHSGSDPKALEQKTASFLDQFARLPKEGASHGLIYQKFEDAYLYSKYENGRFSGGSIENVKIFGGIGIFILIISCINFVNLSTVQAATRAKEVGVRKSVGSGFYALFWQFIAESITYSVVAGMFSLLLLLATIPVVNDLFQLAISVPFNDPYFWVTFVSIITAGGLLAGIYPALFLSSLKPANALKEKLNFGIAAVLFRRGLVVFQFVISIILLVAAIVMNEQTADLGYDKENLIFVRLEGDLASKYAVFKEEAAAIAGVKFVDVSTQPPHVFTRVISNVDWEGKKTDEVVLFQPAKVGYDYVQLMGLDFAAGRNFSIDFATDSAAFIINEEACRRMGLIDPLNHRVSAFGIDGRIVGVLKDYHTQSFKLPHYPLILKLDEKITEGYVLFRTEAGKTGEVLEKLEVLHRALNPNFPFTYNFADTEYEKQYRVELFMSRLSTSFAVVAGIISLLGLWGLAIFGVNMRSKEMVIRKVLGAGTGSILLLLSKGFLRLVLIAFGIAAPIAAYLMRQWLDGFAFRIELSWWIFGISAFVALLTTLLTIGVQSLNLALVSPVRYLRND